MYVSNIIPVEEVLINPEVINTHFSCDLEKCKGACCTFESEYGAPLKEEEISPIHDSLEIIKEYLPPGHKRQIEQSGFYFYKNNELMISSVNRKACVFVVFENGIAKCGIEKAYFDGKIPFRKPISCHLFPIRISKFGGEVLRYERIKECSPALIKGEEEKTTILNFCKDALVRLYGSNWFSKIKKIVGE